MNKPGTSYIPLLFVIPYIVLVLGMFFCHTTFVRSTLQILRFFKIVPKSVMEHAIV